MCAQSVKRQVQANLRSVGAPVWQEWETTLEVSHEWKERVKPLLRLFAERTPGAYVEEKSISLSWHYAKVRPTAAAAPYRLSIDCCSGYARAGGRAGGRADSVVYVCLCAKICGDWTFLATAAAAG